MRINKNGWVKFEDIKPGEYFRDGGRLYIKLQADPEEEFGYAFDIVDRQPCMVPCVTREMVVESAYRELDPSYVWPDVSERKRLQEISEEYRKLVRSLPPHLRPVSAEESAARAHHYFENVHDWGGD